MGDGAKGMSALAPICVTILAHNEQGRIAKCLNSLPLGDAAVAIHVVINGSGDRTAEIARGIAASTPNLWVHEYAQGGKSRSWNRFVLDELPEFHDVHIFADGDAEIVAGSISALAATLAANREANGASAFPRNGRRAEHYSQLMRTSHGIFGDLYALRGDFLRRMKAAGIRLPDDLIGDDGLIGALVKTDLKNEDDMRPNRLPYCEGAGFLCEPVKLWNPASWQLQYARMINYSVRHYQNVMISEIMKGPGPTGLPRKLASLYPDELPVMKPRGSFLLGHFDRLALQRMAAAVSA
jgi:glycosyltransferase involved in cell wall biosynthesis